MFKSLFFSLLAVSVTFADTSLLKPNDRILFVGDSITGQGAREHGWVGLIDEALKATHPNSKFTLVPLGGSGQGVGSWQNVEKKSRTESSVLDVKTIDLKDALGQSANVIVSMLGMNDVLFPRMKQTDADYDKWLVSYQELIASLKARTNPRIIALATPTLCTEDTASPKNVTMQALNTHLYELGKSSGFAILPTYETMEQILAEGRSYRPDFHVLVDFVHPNAAGHLAIAMGMLKGLGEDKAADYLYTKYTPNLWDKSKAALSWQVDALPCKIDSPTQSYRIRYDLHPSTPPATPVTLTLPEGWKQISANNQTASGDFVVEGPPDHLMNRLTLKAGDQQNTVEIPAPWLIGVASEGGANWIQNTTYDPTKKIFATDEALSKGQEFGTLTEREPGKPFVWKRHTASINYGGGGNTPGAIDMAGVTFYQTFDVAFGARWIYSESERPLTLAVKPYGFVANSYLTVWLNGKTVFGDLIKNAKTKGDMTIQLKKGWNALVFRSNHLQTQWQFAIDLSGDHLDSLKVSAIPQN